MSVQFCVVRRKCMVVSVLPQMFCRFFFFLSFLFSIPPPRFFSFFFFALDTQYLIRLFVQCKNIFALKRRNNSVTTKKIQMYVWLKLCYNHLLAFHFTVCSYFLTTCVISSYCYFPFDVVGRMWKLTISVVNTTFNETHILLYL